MNQRDFNHAVARATGESIDTIAQRGFVLLRAIPFEREPRTAQDHEHLGAVPASARRPPKRRAAA